MTSPENTPLEPGTDETPDILPPPDQDVDLPDEHPDDGTGPAGTLVQPLD